MILFVSKISLALQCIQEGKSLEDLAKLCGEKNPSKATLEAYQNASTLVSSIEERALGLSVADIAEQTQEVALGYREQVSRMKDAREEGQWKEWKHAHDITVSVEKQLISRNKAISEQKEIAEKALNLGAKGKVVDIDE